MGMWSFLSHKRAEPMRLAIVGCGDIAGYTAWFARLNRGIQLAACCDINSEKATAFARRHKIPKIFTETGRMLDEVDVDALYLAVPHDLHYPLLEAAIQSKKHMLVEKPITRTLREGLTITDKADENSIKIGVNYQYRYDAGCYALARLVQRGELGEIYFARINVPWRRQESYFEGASWHKSLKQSGGGTLITQGSHMLDIILWALSQPPMVALGAISTRVFKQYEVEDLAQGILEMQDGALIQISSTMVANPEGSLSIEVYGQKGTAVYKDKSRPKLHVTGIRYQQEHPPHGGVHALQRSIEGFRAWIMEDQPYLTPARQSLPVLAAVEAIYRSARSGCKEVIEFYSIGDDHL